MAAPVLEIEVRRLQEAVANLPAQLDPEDDRAIRGSVDEADGAAAAEGIGAEANLPLAVGAKVEVRCGIERLRVELPRRVAGSTAGTMAWSAGGRRADVTGANGGARCWGLTARDDVA